MSSTGQILWSKSLNGYHKNVIYDNLWVYEGNFKDGNIIGIGIRYIEHMKTHCFTEKFEGEFETANYIKSRAILAMRKGKMTYMGGAPVYEGGFKNDERDGEGIYRYSNGDCYSGCFFRNRRHGLGTMKGKFYPQDWDEERIRSIEMTNDNKGTFLREYTYKGEWKYDRKSGHGVLTYTNIKKKQAVYDGLWKDDLRCGKGRLSLGWDKLLEAGKYWEGDFKNDKLNGHAIFEHICRGGEIGNKYTGEWVDNKQHGTGLDIYESSLGMKYQGQFQNVYFEGAGEIRWTVDAYTTASFREDFALDLSGCVMSGQFSQSRWKSGTLIWPDGTILKTSSPTKFMFTRCTFELPIDTVKGVITFPDGTSVEGEWGDDDLKDIRTETKRKRLLAAQYLPKTLAQWFSLLKIREQYSEIMCKHVDVEIVGDMIEWLESEPEELAECINSAFEEMTTMEEGGAIKKYLLKKLIASFNFVLGEYCKTWKPLDLNNYYNK